MPKRILIFSLVYYPRFIGGAEVAVKEITDRITREEVLFDMVTLRKHAPAFEKIGNVTIYRAGVPWLGKNTKSSKIIPLSKYLFIFSAFLKALKLHHKNHYDLTWSIMANYAGFSALFFKLVHPSVPFLLTLQEGDPLEHIKKRVGLIFPLFRKIFTRADRITAISTFLANWAKSLKARSSIEVVPNGVDIKNFQLPTSNFQTEEIRKKLGIKRSDVVLITTSRLALKNGVGDIVEALQYLPQDVKLFILGTGSLEESLKFKAKNLKLESRVFFLGFISHDNLPRYLHASDIFIRPSLSEGMGNSFIEAMAAGLPVIATPVGGIPDFLKDGETGIFFEAKNPRSIADKVVFLLEHPDMRSRIIENAKKMVKEKYDWDLIAKKMMTVFQKTLKQPSL